MTHIIIECHCMNPEIHALGHVYMKMFLVVTTQLSSNFCMCSDLLFSNRASSFFNFFLLCFLFFPSKLPLTPRTSSRLDSGDDKQTPTDYQWYKHNLAPSPMTGGLREIPSNASVPHTNHISHLRYIRHPRIIFTKASRKSTGMTQVWIPGWQL